MLFHNGTYYWYGEIKSGKTYLPKENASWGGTRVDVAGVSCYASKDLLNWESKGNVLPAVEGGDLDPKKVLERPKVIYNAKTKKFVMWFHSDSLDYSAARCGVAVSDTPTGPFTYQKSFRPNVGESPIPGKGVDKATGGTQLMKDMPVGQMARDMTVFVDDDGKAYLFSASENNATLPVT